MEDLDHKSERKNPKTLVLYENSRSKTGSSSQKHGKNFQKSYVPINKQNLPSQISDTRPVSSLQTITETNTTELKAPNSDRQSVGSLQTVTETNTRELKASNDELKCPEHQQDLQFYCFNDNRLLCGECAISNICSGHQVINVKKASTRIKRKIEELACEMESQVNMFTLWERKIESSKEDFQEVLVGHQDQIVAYLSDLKKKIELKQQEIIQKAEKIASEKAQEFEESLKYVKDMKQEILDVKSVVENNLKTLNEANICEYYSKKSEGLREFLNNEKHPQISEILNLINQNNSLEQFSLKRFQEELEAIIISINSLTGLEDQRKDKGNKFYELMASPNAVKLANDYMFSQTKITNYHSRNTSNNLESLLKSTIYASPSKLALQKECLSPDPKMIDDEKAASSLQARSQNIHKLLDRIFEAKQKMAEGKPERNDKESHEKVEEVQNQNFRNSHQEIENNKTQESLRPLGHSAVYEKNRLFRTSYITDLNPHTASEKNLITSPNQRFSGPVSYSTIFQGYKKIPQSASRKSLKDSSLDVLFPQSTKASKEFTALRNNSGQKKQGIGTRAGLQMQNTFFARNHVE